MTHTTTLPGRAAWIAAALAMIAPLMGCSDAPYALAPASGRVLIDGKPYSAGKVMFAPTDEGDEAKVGKPAFAALEDDGSFRLSTYSDNDGAVVGKHWVTLFNVKHRRTSEHKAVPKFSRLPAISTPVEVVAGEDNFFEISLSLDQIRQYAR